MTTKSEIKRWVRTFVAAHGDVALEGRVIYLRPVHHIVSGMSFRSTRTRTYPEVAWFMDLLFAAPGSWNADFDYRFSVGESNDGAFLGGLHDAMEESFERLRRLSSIATFHDFAIGPAKRFTFLNLDRYGLEHGTVLAALGRLDEAQAKLQATIAECEQWAANEQRADDELQRTKPRPRQTFVLTVARDKMKIVEVVRELLARVESRDRGGIAALLHEWERQNVRKWGVEHLWEPTPFPVEA